MKPKDFALTPDQLAWRCARPPRPDLEDAAQPEGLVGQDRALKALRLGLELHAPGYNVYVAGFQGTGRTTAVKQLLASVAPATAPMLRDRAYVHNFREPDRPVLLEFPVGQAAQFRRDMEKFIAALKRDVAKILEDETIKRERQAVEQEYRERMNRLVSDFDDKLKQHGFTLTKVKLQGFEIPDLMPVVKGKPVPIGNLPDLQRGGHLEPRQTAELTKRYESLRAEFEAIHRHLSDFLKELNDKVSEIERRAVSNVLRLLLADMKTRYPSAVEHLDTVGESVIRELDLFRSAGEERAQPRNELQALISSAVEGANGFFKYQVNVIQDNAGRTECPTVFEDVPTYANLLGVVELQFLKGGAVRTNFMQIKGGSLLRADGGFLVINALDLFLSPGAWPAVKRVLKTGRLEITVPETPLLPGVVTMKPEPIAINTKVVLIGDPLLYDLLWHFEEDFRKTFKVKAEFDSEMKLDAKTQAHFASVVSRICTSEKLLPLDAGAVASILEEGVRRAGRRGRITTRFSEVADLAREACYWARKDEAKAVGSAHVRRAVDERNARHQLVEEKLQNLIEEGTLAIEVTGARVGQVNGLSVYDLGTYAFGRPSRITASVAVGRAGVVSIEREAGLSGRFHDKGVLTIAGLLRERYAQDFPLSLSASIAFEQSYGAVEGDSASSSEICALLSALSGVPIRQSIAVTGSVDQKGALQAIGGVNQKIEGFYAVCKVKGLTGDQGVIIPRANVEDLMLRAEVVDAVARGQFHVWAVGTLDEGLEILTGGAAGVRDAAGAYPTDSINGRAEARLRAFATTLARFERGLERSE